MTNIFSKLVCWYEWLAFFSKKGKSLIFSENFFKTACMFKQFLILNYDLILNKFIFKRTTIVSLQCS